MTISLRTILNDWTGSESQSRAIDMLEQQLLELDLLSEDKLWARLWRISKPQQMLDLQAEISLDWESKFTDLTKVLIDFGQLDDELKANRPVLLKIMENSKQWCWVLCIGKTTDQKYLCLNELAEVLYSRDQLRAKWTTKGFSTGISKLSIP